MQFRHFASDHHVPRFAKYLDHIGQRLHDSVWSLIKHLRPRRTLDRFQSSPPLAALWPVEIR